MTVPAALTVLLANIALLCSTLGSPRLDLTDRLIAAKLLALSSSGGGETIDCGSTSAIKPRNKASLCAETAFRKKKPFHVLYSDPAESWFYSRSSYGLAGDAHGNVYGVLFSSRGLLHLGMGKNSKVFDGNRIRVTPCIKPVHLSRTEEGIVACITPVDELASKLAAQQKLIDTTVCTILNDPAAFNNKLVRVHGYVSGNFEYSELGADDCSGSIWFAYGNGGGPPGLVASVNGGARPGAEDAEGRLILPVPVKLVEDSHFRRFEKLMRARAEADERSLKVNASTLILHRVAATFVGRVDGVPDDVHAFHLKRKNTDRADYLGFGQMGLFDAQFALQSVDDDPVVETFPPVTNPVATKAR